MGAVETYLVPETVEEAAEALARGEVTILAGGTKLMPQTRAGRRRLAPTLMNITRIEAMKGVREAGGAIRIGALTTITELLEARLIETHLPVLAEAADCFGSGQVRNAATIGGNLANASPAGDTIVPLLVLGAAVELVSKAGAETRTRTVPLAGFFAGPGRTIAAPGEILLAVSVPLPEPGFVARFFKFGTRPALDTAAVSVGIAGVRHNGGLKDPRVAFGAVAPTPLRAVKTEAALAGRALDRAAIDEIAALALGEVAPISDVRASAWYRREMIANALRRMLADVA